VVADDEAGGFELSQNPVHRGEANLLTLGSKTFGYFLSTQMAVGGLPLLEYFQYFDAWECDLESRISDVFAFQGDCSVGVLSCPIGYDFNFDYP
jgi:hypothetical protein